MFRNYKFLINITQLFADAEKLTVQFKKIPGGINMSRRFRGNMRGEKFLGNVVTKELHDLDLETSLCRIDEIIKAGHDQSFNSLEEAKFKGYINCAHCLGNDEQER